MNEQPQEYPKCIGAPEGWRPGGKPFREFHVGRDGKMSVVVQGEEDEQEILRFVEPDVG